ncbi:hypothetical protein [Cupriavidus pinatubonensis]|uniref:hypothetical protein n=1 Tax=Cupriavidus pinatubonensis TaxID=248026 RepID=UPI00112C317B|nr:hypothetical protein [Cupriavidus pinatubonensis]TPQ27110.1 hypothetical protein C2U69_34355 [Cupriavidus pinatubonensis]
MSAAPILYEDFVPGALIGERVEIYDAEQARRWQSIFGEETEAGANGAAEGASMAVIGMMRGYLNVVTPRPPGNVHARQVFRMHGIPQPGESIRIVVRCADKALRRERKYVELTVKGSGANSRALFDAVLTLIWAA